MKILWMALLGVVIVGGIFYEDVSYFVSDAFSNSSTWSGGNGGGGGAVGAMGEYGSSVKNSMSGIGGSLRR